ncbi:MAG: hypothetical protein FJY88_03150 [Candidatus Eisenbacteria bacterium]|nr:hypothetical protein [Candidatus Eisenbacteria bacterium]
MSPVRHESLARGRWFTFTLCEQMGHVGSEVGRALRWRERNRKISSDAVERAIELIDLTLDDPRHRRSAARLREIARAREVLLDFFVGENAYRSDGSSLQRYFDAFAVAAARERSLNPP